MQVPAQVQELVLARERELVREPVLVPARELVLAREPVLVLVLVQVAWAAPTRCRFRWRHRQAARHDQTRSTPSCNIAAKRPTVMPRRPRRA